MILERNRQRGTVTDIHEVNGQSENSEVLTHTKEATQRKSKLSSYCAAV